MKCCVFVRLSVPPGHYAQNDSKESQGVLGQAGKQARELGSKLVSKQAREQASKQAGKHTECIQSEPCHVGAC